MQRIAIINQKGGVGKTTSAVNLAAAYAEAGRRVVLIDLDPQGHASLHLKRRELSESVPVQRLLLGQTTAEEAAQSTGYGFDLIAGGRALGAAEYALMDRQAVTALDDALENCTAWDIAICDCPPSLGALSTTAIFASTAVLVPILLQTLPLDSLGLLGQTLRSMRKLKPGVKVGAIFGTNSNPRTRMAQSVLSAVQESVGAFGPLAETRIRTCTELDQAVYAGMPITAFRPNGSGAADYRALAKELVQLGAVQ